MVADLGCEFALLLSCLAEDLQSLASAPADVLQLGVANTLGVLGHPVRRAVLRLLAERGVLDRDELAAALVEDEGVASADAARLGVLLHHAHLPKLDAHGYVDYDPRSGDTALFVEPSAVEAELDPDRST